MFYFLVTFTMLVNIHFLLYTHLIELNSANVPSYSNVSISDVIKNPKLFENELNSSETKLNSSMFFGKSYVCFCSENAVYYNFLIYTFPW